MSKAKYTDEEWGFYPGTTLWDTYNDAQSGVVANENGFVCVYASTWDSKDGPRHWTRFVFINRGRIYSRSFTQRFTERGISRLANKFAREVVNGEIA